MTHVGITGHQRLEHPSGWSWVAQEIRAELDKCLPPIIAITSLAIGADQLFAKLALERGGSIYAVLPYAAIEQSFSPQDLSTYRHLAEQAKQVEVLQTAGDLEDSYFAAGRRVVDLSDVVLAVWNGKPAKGKGGTADIVAYTIRKGVPLVHIDPVNRYVRRL